MKKATAATVNVLKRIIALRSISLWHCRAEGKRGRIPACEALGKQSVSLALGDDFKTINGKEYKNVTVSRLEPDGILLRTKSGISKVYFVELPKEVQERFHYDPEKAAAAQAAAVQQAEATNKQAEGLDRRRKDAYKE